VNDHDHDHYADEEHEYPTRAEEKAAEIALDVADEERHAAEEATADAATAPDDHECQAELIDGSWTYCGCEECDERETRDGDEAFESGHASEEEPW
jgi:monoamine oxidase